MEQPSEHQSSKCYFGIDNGSTGACAHISSAGELLSMLPMPTRKLLNYTKSKQMINRLDGRQFATYLRFSNLEHWDRKVAVMERPMVNPARFKQSVAAVRFLEATLVVLESMDIPVLYVDSRQWQRELLPEGLSDVDLKPAAVQKARELFPTWGEKIDKKTADAVLIAEYARRHNL